MQNRHFRLLSAITFSFVISSCGPSAEEKAAAEKYIQDSIAVAKAQLESAKEAARLQATEDSLLEVDSAQVKE